MSQKRILAIDCQVLQTSALHRGMGKYTLAVLEEYRKQRLPYDEVVVVLGDTELSEQDERTLQLGLSGFTVVRLPLHKTIPAKPEGYAEVAKGNRWALDQYLEKTFGSAVKVDFLITSLFHEDGCSVFPTQCCNKYLLVYDLIPLQFPDYYLKDLRGKQQYLSRFKELFKATHFFTISETVANDLSLNLGIPQDRITPVYGSYISRKKLKGVTPKGVRSSEKFILMPTGDDARKNNLRAVMAFEEFNSKSGYAYKLVITSFFSDKTKRELMMQSDHLIFSGNVSEPELAWLYQNASLIFFPSEYEGLGMPPLEAAEFNQAVLCSDITVVQELSQLAFYFCNPYSVADMAAQLQALLMNGTPKINAEEYTRILKKYTWAETTRAMIRTYIKDVENEPELIPKRKIAVFAPSPEGYSAIGKVVQEQHYQLSRLGDVDYYLEEGVTSKAKEVRIRVSYLPHVSNTYNAWLFGARESSRYDRVVYHLGNSEYHVVAAIKALAFPDTVVLHDTNLSGMLSIVSNLGYINNARYQQEEVFQKALFASKGIKPIAQKGNYIATIINTAKRVVTHSTYAEDAVSQLLLRGSKTDIMKLELPTPVPYKAYGHDKDRPLTVAYAGIIHPAKGIGLVGKLAKAHYNRPAAIKLFGFSLIDTAAEAALLENENVTVVQSPTDTRFIYELSTSDVVVGFRPDYHGETSLSTIEALRLGKAVVVNDKGWFSELPSELVYKVKDADSIVGAIKDAALSLDNKELIEKRLTYVRTRHAISKYVSELVGE